MSGVPFSVPDFSMHFFPVLGIEISASHSQSVSGALWAGCSSLDRTFRCTFYLFCALRFQCLTAKAPQEPCGRGAVFLTGQFDALFPVLGIEISASHSQSVSGALWAVCRSLYWTVRCSFHPFCALKIQHLVLALPELRIFTIEFLLSPYFFG